MSLKSLTALIAGTLAFTICGSHNPAQAANISASTGIFTAGQLEAPGSPVGLGTSSISWGESSPPGGPSSSYSFTGRSNFTLPEDGTPTSLGVFTHNNFVLTLASNDLASATLTLNLSGDINKSFNFEMNHLETTNNPPAGVSCEAGGVAPCPDLVTFLNFFSEESVDIADQSFLLKILGFQRLGVITPGLVTAEGQPTSAEVIAQLTPAATAVPTPALLPGLIGFGMSIARKRKK